MIEQDPINQKEQLSIDQLAKLQLDYSMKCAKIIELYFLERYYGREPKPYVNSPIFLVMQTHIEKGVGFALNNPVSYLKEVRLEQLPEKLRQGWSDLFNLSEPLIKINSTKNTDWNQSTNNLEQLQRLIHSTGINSNYQNTLSNIVRLSSDLFAQSIKEESGNIEPECYEDNLEAMRQEIDNCELALYLLSQWQ